MTENKLYAQCREEAARQMIQKNSHLEPPIAAVLCDDEIKQLTCEIYGMKLLDMTAKELYLKCDHNGWELHKAFKDLKIIGSTKGLHDHFVREFNKENN